MSTVAIPPEATPPSTTTASDTAISSLVRDTCTVFARAMRMSLRNPAWLLISPMQPILYITWFGMKIQ